MVMQVVENPAHVQDILPIQAVDHVHFYVGNARQAAHYYSTAFGFTPIAYAGPETGVRDRASYVLRQNDMTFVFTGAIDPDTDVARHVWQHGDGVKDICFRVDNVERAYNGTTARGATGLAAPSGSEDSYGTVRKATIAAYGETTHSFIDRSDYAGIFAPGYRAISGGNHDLARSVGLRMVDHIVANVERGKMNEWVEFYARVMGFYQLVHFDDQAIRTEYSALMSKVMQNGTGRIKLPINEPADGLKKSQIEEYLEFYKGPGVQHIALATDDIIATVTDMRGRGVEFMNVPESYYADLEARIGPINESVDDLRRLNILVDRDEEGYLLQIFTRMVTDRPTMFYEIIQRCGATGFGEGNFKALFEAIERDQDARGNL